MDISTLFPVTYEQSRERFRQGLTRFQKLWPNAQLHQHALSGEPDITIDWITAQALESSQKTLIFTTGEHGMEGFVGSAMLELFLERFLPLVDPKTTNLLFVHAINPWGMKHHRRVNRNNIDLNRSFLIDLAELDPHFNPGYRQLYAFLNPNGPQGELTLFSTGFLLRIAAWILKLGVRRFRDTTLLGQYAYPEGIYFGGQALQEETAVLMELYRQAFSLAERVLHLDMHTGYGPRYQMSMINSPLDGRDSLTCSQAYQYPLVMAATSEEFYALRGDMIDYVYRLRDKEFPGLHLYSTTFEFGTYGHSTMAAIRSLRTMMLENRLFWYGAKKASIDEKIRNDFRELFYPQETAWREKAITDADQAFSGILKAEGFIH